MKTGGATPGHGPSPVAATRSELRDDQPSADLPVGGI